MSSTGEPIVKRKVKPIVKRKVKPIVKRKVKPIVKRKVKPIVKRKVKPIVKRKVKPIVKRKVKPIVKRKVKPIVKPTVNIESRIKYCRIYPGIGIARLGNSPDDYFIGTEVSGSPSTPEDNLFKDVQGRVKRQAARFHIYAYDSNDKVLKELTADDCSITWKVHLANKKGLAKKFVGRYLDEQNKELRNSDVVDRMDLLIDPGQRSISGINQSGKNFKFDTGKFFGITVPLGEIRTDEKGRLIVLGGFGKSDSVDREKFKIEDYANNDGWFDDISDGPVTALVTLNSNGKTIPIKDNAWVIVAPPKFAPYHYPIITLYDTMKEVALEQKWITKPKEVSFMRDILPLFHRVLQYKWLNNRVQSGHGTPGIRGGILENFGEISANNANTAGTREMIFLKVRNPNFKPESDEAKAQANYEFMPIMSGDGGGMRRGNDTTFMKILPSQYDNLKKWSKGDFISDFDDSQYTSEFKKVLFQRRTLDEIPLEEQPQNLDKSALELSIGGPFFPGIEITFIASDPDLYDGKAFRINPNLEPGDITQYMALPWQADFLECNETWWPIARPDDVIPEQNEKVREKWARGSDGEYFNNEDHMKMVIEWDKLGFIKPKKVGDDILFIESERSY